MKLSRVLKVALLSVFFCLSNSYSKEGANQGTLALFKG
jgi:hypothetical protein